jgi:nicotinamidase/pyrazinamidase
MKTLFLDIDTQIDFLYPAGALYAPGAERIVPAVARLNRYAVANGIAAASTLDTHTANDPEFRRHGFPAHCVRGTAGWNKPASTFAGQRLFEKNTFDAFSSPELTAWVRDLAPDRVVVYGVVTEICVAAAIRNLFQLLPKARIELVTDALCPLDQAKANDFLAWFTGQGGTLTTAAAVCS